ncbi:MAG: Ig-like domain-containing protein, partial [Mycobacterium sp.]
AAVSHDSTPPRGVIIVSEQRCSAAERVNGTGRSYREHVCRDESRPRRYVRNLVMEENVMSTLPPRRPESSATRRFKIASVALLAAVLALAPIHPPLAHGQPITGGGFTTDASVDPTRIAPGGSAAISVSVTSDATTTALVDVEVYSSSGTLVYQQTYDNQSFVAGNARSYSVAWSVPLAEPEGTHAVRIGIFGAAWGPLRHWNHYAASFNIAASTSTRTTVMPLGDSLTDGYNIPGGYRPDLLAKFVADNLAVDFVGSLSNGPAALTDREHEGHSGWRIDQISASVVSWMNAYRPDIVLLMIGTNDMVQDYQLSTAPDRLSALIDQITATLPTSHVIVASIPRIGGSPNLERVQAYDATIPGIVNAKIAEGKHVSYADIYGVIGPGDLHTDFTHINSSGNTKMANVWYPAIRSALGLAPPADTTPPTVASTAPIGGATGVGTQSNVTATFSEPIDPMTLGGATFELRNGAGAVVTAAVTYEAATLTAMLDPGGPLATGASYTATIRGGSSDPRVKDTNGNALASDRVWSFTTASGTAPSGFTSGGYTTSATATPSTVRVRNAVQLGIVVTSAVARSALVDVEVYGPTGVKVFQRAWDGQSFAAGQQRSYTASWSVPSNAATGRYVVRVGIFKPGWAGLYHWNSSAAQITVSR